MKKEVYNGVCLWLLLSKRYVKCASHTLSPIQRVCQMTWAENKDNGRNMATFSKHGNTL